VRFGRIPSRRPTLLTISLFDWPLRSGRTKRP
jgi:hypothetical protein